MIKQYDKLFDKIRPDILKALESMDKVAIPLSNTIAAAGIAPEDKISINSFIEELRKYFHKLEIAAYESKSRSGDAVIMFEEGIEEEEEYGKFLDIYNKLGKTFVSYLTIGKYLSDTREGFCIDSEDLMEYISRQTHQHIETDSLHFLDGLRWYLSSRAEINMSIKPLISMKIAETGDIKGLMLLFEKA